MIRLLRGGRTGKVAEETGETVDEEAWVIAVEEISLGISHAPKEQADG